MGLQENIAARKLAVELFSILTDETAGLTCEQMRRRFWENIVKLAKEQLPKVPEKAPPADKPMTADERVAFERTGMPFGKYTGRQIEYVPLDYLLWLEAESGKFLRRMRRYLANDAVQKEQGDGDG